MPLTHQGEVKNFEACGTAGWGESDVEEILAALERLYADAALRKTIGQTGADWIVKSGRTWASHASHMKSLLLSL